MSSIRPSKPDFGIPVYPIIILCLFSLKLALVVALLDGNPEVFLYGDGREYAAIAENIVRSGVYARAPDATSEAFRLPGYPIFLTLFQAFDAGYRYHVVSIVQLILFHGWLFLICRWIARRHGDRSAVIFAILLSSTITWTHYPATIHSDFLFAALLFAGAALLARNTEREHGHLILAGGLLCIGAASLTRPDLMALPVWLLVSAAICALISRFRRTPALAVAPQLLVALGGGAAMIAWGWRNYLATGQFSYTATTKFAAVWFTKSVGETPAAESGGDSSVVDLFVFLAGHLDALAAGFVPALVQLMNPARWYLHRYLDALGVETASIGVPYSEIGLAGLPPMEIVYMAFNIAVSAIILTMFVYFFIQLIRIRPVRVDAAMPLLLLVLIYLVVQKGVWGTFTEGSGPRYAVSIYPFLVYFASISVSRIFRPDAAR